MQSAEEFMLDFFRERGVMEKKEQEILAPYRQRFYNKNCRHDSRDGTLAMIESERIISSSSTDAKAEIITQQEVRPPIHGIDHFRIRYHLELANGRWLVHSVDPWCLQCFGTPGKTACLMCGGEGWMSGKVQQSKPPEDDPLPPSPQAPPRRF
jgi:hypothetical protein